MDDKGFHCILCNDSYQSFYININMEGIRYLPNLNGLKVTAVAWDNTCPELSTKVKQVLPNIILSPFYQLQKQNKYCQPD